MGLTRCASYLYLAFDASELHIVNVASGVDRVLVSGKRLYPLAWTADHIYLEDYPGGTSDKTYSVSVPGGVLTPLSARLVGVVPVSGTGAWVIDVSPTVPHANGQNGPIGNRVSRVDLDSGQKVEWFSAPNATVTLLGFTQSNSPLVESTSSSSGTVVVRLAGPDRVVETYPLAHPAVGAANDTHGTWLLTDGDPSLATVGAEVLLYNEGSAPKLLATAPAGLFSFRLDGGCASR